MSQELIIQEILKERDNQDKKWGVQNHDPFKWVSILAEEVGEVASETLKRSTIDRLPYPSYRDELIQVAATAIATVESYDRLKEEGSDTSN